jgi:uncharacterized lipoprotein YmbA
MPMRRAIKFFSLTLLLSLGACGTSPEPSFYTLASIPGTNTSTVTATVKVMQPELPKFLDRPDFVSQTNPYQVSVNETANWAEPLATMFERTLTDNLQQRLPMAAVESDASDNSFTAPRFVIETTLQQFNAEADGQVALRGDWQLTDLSKSPQPQHFVVNLTTNNCGSSPTAVTAALSALLGSYADQIAATIAAAN